MTVTRWVSSAGWKGGPQYRLLCIRARAPLVDVCLLIACVQMAGNCWVRVVRWDRMVSLEQVCLGDGCNIHSMMWTGLYICFYNKWPEIGLYKLNYWTLPFVINHPSHHTYIRTTTNKAATLCYYIYVQIYWNNIASRLYWTVMMTHLWSWPGRDFARGLLINYLASSLRDVHQLLKVAPCLYVLSRNYVMSKVPKHILEMTVCRVMNWADRQSDKSTKQ